LTLGSGIRVWDPEGKLKSRDSGSGITILDFVFQNEVSVFGLKILKFFDADPELGCGILSTLDPKSGMKKSDPGS
jgi:hypothetical protein